MPTTFRNAIKLFIIAVLMLPSAVWAQAADREALIDTLSKRLAVKAQLEDITSDLESQFEQNPMQIASDKNNTMLDFFDQAYDPDLLLNDFKSAFQRQLDEHSTQAMQNWLNQCVTKKVTDARAGYYTLQGKRKRVVAMYEMEQNTPDAKRAQLIDSITDTTSAVQSSINQSIIVLKSVIKAINAISDQRNFSDSQINDIVHNFQMQLNAQAGEQLHQQWMVMYYDVPVETLSRYTNFLQSDTGQWLTKTVDQSMESALQSAANRFLQSVNKAQ